jgi:predicted phosphodiesterase
MPPEIKKLMFSTTDTTTTNIDYTPIDLVSNNKAIVFTGDLIDRGAYTVRNLLNMLKLKSTYQDNVILICGNRDINKIRMYHECYIEDIDTQILKGGAGLGIVEIMNR